jgi:methylenetetrahydrofolate reductase (NADPH)
MLKTMREGKDMVGNDLNGAPDVFIGALGHPGANPLEPQMIKLRKKIKAGAQFLQTQAIYEPEAFAEFMRQLEGTDVKVLAGIVPLKSARMAYFMNQSVPGIKVPDSLIKRMEETKDKEAEAVAITVELIEKLRGVCHGVHIMAVGMEKVLPRILDEAGFK